jgi:hypothetical protein
MDLPVYTNSLNGSSVTCDQWRDFPYAYFPITNIVRIYIYFMRFRIVTKTSSPYLCHGLSVCLSHMYQCGHHWMDFREIWYWGLLKILVELQICYNLAQISGTWRPKCFSYFANDMSLIGDNSVTTQNY